MGTQSLSSFCGNLYKKYPSVELVGLLQYIANTLKSGQSLQLLLLRDLVTKMSGIDVLEDLSQEQLHAQVPPPLPASHRLHGLLFAAPHLPLGASAPPCRCVSPLLLFALQAGGETLRNVVTDLHGIAKNTKRSSTRLKEALLKHGAPRRATALCRAAPPFSAAPRPCRTHVLAAPC